MTVDAFRIASAFALAVLLQFSLTGCDNSGGGDDSDSGSIETELSPDSITEESLAFLRVRISESDFDDLDTQGLTVKILVPEELDLMKDTTSITLDHGAVPIEPLAIAQAPRVLVNRILSESGVDTNSESFSSGDFLMYVFPITPARFSEDEDEGELQMTFEVNGVPSESVIFVDVDRGAVSSFDVEHADFDPESTTEFEVERQGIQNDDDE